MVHDNPRTTSMLSVDGGPSAVDDRDREGKSPRQCVTAQDDEIDRKAIVNV